MVKAKLFVQSVLRSAHAPDQLTVQLCAVTRGEENREWSQATPAARFELTITNPQAAAFFVLGQEVYVTFEQAEPIALLSDGHAFESKDSGQYGPRKCSLCSCSERSHEEPLRSAVIAALKI